MIDPRRIVQVLNNLFSNASRHSPRRPQSTWKRRTKASMSRSPGVRTEVTQSRVRSASLMVVSLHGGRRSACRCCSGLAQDGSHVEPRADAQKWRRSDWRCARADCSNSRARSLLPLNRPSPAGCAGTGSIRGAASRGGWLWRARVERGPLEAHEKHITWACHQHAKTETIAETHGCRDVLAGAHCPSETLRSSA